SDAKFAAVGPSILYETLGCSLPDGADAAAAWWPGAHKCAAELADAVRRAGIDGEGFELGEALFAAILSSRSGLAFTHLEYDETWRLLRHPDQRVHLAVSELLDWLGRLDPADAKPDPD